VPAFTFPDALAPSSAADEAAHLAAALKTSEQLKELENSRCSDDEMKGVMAALNEAAAEESGAASQAEDVAAGLALTDMSTDTNDVSVRELCVLVDGLHDLMSVQQDELDLLRSNAAARAVAAPADNALATATVDDAGALRQQVTGNVMSQITGALDAKLADAMKDVG
jgi:hypothetical protein